MKNIDGNLILIIIGFGAILLELMLGAATGFDLLLLGVAFVIGGFIGMVFHSFILALIIVFILSVLYISIGRKTIKSKLAIKTTKTNIEGIMDKSGKVIKEIRPNKPGQVKVEGEIWRAEAPVVISEGASVKIQSVTGVTLSVTPEK
jgi:membrane protein implicated in regulation of membrane protease activity